MPGLLRQTTIVSDSSVGPTQRSIPPTRLGPGPAPGPAVAVAGTRLGLGRTQQHVRSIEVHDHDIAHLTFPPPASFAFIPHPRPTSPIASLGCDDHAMAVNPGDPLYDAAHYRMPGEDDQGQAARAALYVHETDSETEFSFGGVDDDNDDEFGFSTTPGSTLDHQRPTTPTKQLEWNWDTECADRAREKRHDGNDTSFQVDRKVLRDVVKEKLGTEVARIRFLSSGTFHKAYLITLSTSETLIARVARRFMPRLKTESEVATMAYLRAYTSIPVPKVYAWDSNPYNRLGGEYILMSRARGIPLRRVYHSMPLLQLTALMQHLAEMLIPLFGHRFSHIGSLYFEEGKFQSQVKLPVHKNTEDDDHGLVPTPKQSQLSRINSVDFAFGSSLPTPTRTPWSATIALPTPKHEKGRFPGLMLGHTSKPTPLGPIGRHRSSIPVPPLPEIFHVGPIVSWPFFGSNRGDLSHTSFPPEIERGPWTSASAYLHACTNREILGVARENEGRAKPHRLHLDPDDFLPRGVKKQSKKGEYIWGYGFVRRARLSGCEEDDDEDDGDDQAGDNDSEVPSDDRQESDDESGSGSPTLSIGSDVDEDMMYQDYRRFQRSTFLVAELQQREKRVRGEMERWRRCMNALERVLKEVVDKVNAKYARLKEGVGGNTGLFSLDCHDLSLDNVFVDEKDHSRITCIIDWESTTTRPLWACAHLPSFLLSSPFCSNLFRKVVANLPVDKYPDAHDWLVYERAGAPLRYAHKCVEWDGWEERLVDSILGPIEQDDERSSTPAGFLALLNAEPKEAWEKDDWEEPLVTQMRLSYSSLTNGPVPDVTKLPHPLSGAPRRAGHISPTLASGLRRASHSSAGSELEMERMLDTNGDICGGRGGELGRRLEAWLIEGSPQRETKELE